jgi:hypothetical protein
MDPKTTPTDATAPFDAQAEASELGDFLKKSFEDGKPPEPTEVKPKVEKKEAPKIEPKKEEAKPKEIAKPKEETTDETDLEDDDLEGLSAFTKKKAKPKEESKPDESDKPKEEGTGSEADKPTTGDEALDLILEKVTVGEKAHLSTKEAFDAVKKAAQLKQESLSKEIEALKKQNEELSTGTVVASELKKVKEENEALKKYQEDAEKKLSILDVRNSRRYHDTVKAPLDNISKEVETLATKYTLDPKTLKALINPNTPYDELARVVEEANINEEDKDSLKDYRKQLKTVLSTRKQLEEDSKSTRERLELEHKQQQQEFMEKRTEILNEAKSLYKDTILLKLQDHFEKLEGEGEEVESWNKVVDTFHNTLTKVDPAQMTVEQQGMVTTFAAAFPVLAAKVEILQKDKDLLIEKLRKFKKAAPAAGPGAKSSTGGATQSNSDLDAPLGDWLAKGLGTR